MHQVTLYIACSLDGYIAKADGDISFLSAVEMPGEDYGYSQFIQTVDTVIMGRKAYDKVLSFGIDFPHAGKKCYVLSHSRTGSDENVEFFSGDVGELIQSIRSKGGKNIFVDGGAELVHELLKQKLIDKFVISIIPVLLGSGVRLFKEDFPEQKLKLIQAKTFKSGLVQVWYERGAS